MSKPKKGKVSSSKKTKETVGPSRAQDSEPRGAPLSKRRLWLFRLTAISIPLVIFLLIEIAFRIIPGLNEDRDPYVNISPVSVFSRKTIDGQEYYHITHRFVLGGHGVKILVKKPANTIRIFCLGSSACAGWPHPPNETFSAYLQQALEAAYPKKKIEVINAAAHGFAAYRTRLVLDEVLQMGPDAVIVWEGNNEFLEDRNYDSPGAVLGNLGRHLRIVQWLRSINAARTEMSGEDLKDMAEFFWKKTRQQSLRLREDPVQFAQVQEHFRKSFEHMVRQSQRNEAPIVLCTVPVNLRDWVPTVSVNHLKGQQLEQWQKLYNLSRRCLLENRYKEGIETMGRAIAMEGDHGESYFWLGRLLEADGQKAAAWEAFSKARDNDYNPFRAVSSFNETIRTLATENQDKGVSMLDLERLFSGAGKYAAPGFDLFLDYVHPTKPANLMVAENLFNLMIRGGVLKEKPAVDRFTYHDLPTGPNGKPYREETDVELQIAALTMAMENRQYETVVNKVEFLVEQNTGHRPTAPDDPVFNHPALKNLPPKFIDGYRAFRNYLDVERRVILELSPSESDREDAKRQIAKFYEKWYPFGSF